MPMISAREMALAILSLPEDQQNLPLAYYDDARFICVDASEPLNVLFIDTDGYESSNTSGTKVLALGCIL